MLKQHWGCTHSRTLCICSGCKKGLPIKVDGVLLSETEVVGNARFCREPEGLKSPGEDMGVLLAVLRGMDAEGGMWACSCCGCCWAGRLVDAREEDEGCCESDWLCCRRWCACWW